MSPNARSLGALTLAVAIHGFIAILLFSTTSLETPKKPLQKRFGIHFSDPLEPQFSDQSDLPPPPHVPPKTAQMRPAVPAVTALSKEPKGILSPSPVQKPFSEADSDALPQSVLRHYGEEFFDLSAGEQRYILDNLQKIRKINEVVGTRLLREKDNEEIDPYESNLVEFYLYPDGTISDLQLEHNRVGSLLDELTLQTIDLAHEKYPKPAQKTLIRIRVYIIVR